MKKELIILVGNIGCGKSTIAKRYAADGYIIIARDGLRYMIGGSDYLFDYDYEPIIWKTERFIFKQFIDMGISVVVDEVGVTKLMRRRYIAYAKSEGYNIIAVVMPRLSMKKAVRNRMKNPHGQPDKKLWEGVWKKFDKGYEEPDKSEGFDNIIKLRKI